MEKLLKRAQDAYGYANQITVATEELCELACVLARYPRYHSHEAACTDLRDRVVDELADVTVVSKHVQMIFDITPEELQCRIQAKLARLERWLDTDSSLETTTKDRKVEPNCKTVRKVR